MFPELSDEALVRQAQQGDWDSFQALYDRYLNKVYNRVKSRIPPEDVEDVTQDIFVVVVHALKGFEARSRFNTWLYTIVNRQIADYYRRRYRKGENAADDLEMVEDTIPAGGGGQENLDEQIEVQAAIQRLPEHYQEIILQRFADGLTFEEIAQQRGQSLEAVKSLYRRAIQAVRDQIGGEPDG